MPRGSKLRDERSTRGYLREPLGRTITSTQIDQSRILLAYNDEGCIILSPILRQMPEVQQSHQAAVRKTDTYDGTLAVRAMGT